ncbi:hypothetical protein EQT97_02240 [Fructilactobacillus sanfranciscensis]|nr:SNG1 family protein [Fructilactobacillus sanfranciscensis]MCG7194360.1 hypothetical protein [Fructilactobacillus sanfranciscensis]
MTLAQLPTAKSTIQNVPVGIVNQDQGPIGKSLTNKAMHNKTKADHADHPMFKWYEYKTIKAANHALSFNGNYATVIIPKDLSQSVQTVGQTGQKSTVKIVINQGRNHTLATNVSSVLTSLLNKVGTSIGTGVLAKMAVLNLSVPASKAEAIANPINVKTSIVHSTKNLEAASSVFFQPIWITSLVPTMLLYFASRAFQPKHKKDVLAFKGTVVGIVALLSLIVGFVTTFYVSQFLGYHFPDSPLISLFLAIATFAFIMLFSGVIAWIGIPGVVILALLMFFSLPLMVMAPQMLPQAYQDYFLPWLPMRFLYEGIREILYFKAGFLNQNTWSLIIVAGIGLLMFFLETFGKRHQKTFI